MDKTWGIGLRPEFYKEVLAGESQMEWFEVISENFMDSGGRPLAVLSEVRERYPVAIHGVCLNVGSSEPVDKQYLIRLKRLIKKIDPWIVTDHLCWGGIEGRHWHDLLPLPMNEKSIISTVQKIKKVQDILERRIALENISTYLRFKSDTMSEWDFISAILYEADCDLLLDVNNVYVNSINHGFDPYVFISALAPERVRQIHIAGHSAMETFLFDTHDAPVIEPVWDLYRYAIQTLGLTPTLLEWDDKIPALAVIEAEISKAKALSLDLDRKRA